MSFSVHLKPGGKTIPFKYDFTKSSNDIPNVKKLHTVMKKNTLDFLTIYLAIGKKKLTGGVFAGKRWQQQLLQ